MALVTSRDRLAGLMANEGARMRHLDTLTPDEAAQVLTHAVGSDPARREPEAVLDLARLCGFLPLALRVAAANVAARPQRHRRLCPAPARPRPAGCAGRTRDPHNAVSAAFALSYTRLPDAALDIGTRRDFTALAVAHAESGPAGRIVVVDRVLCWRPSSPSSGNRVDLDEVESAVVRLSKTYNGAPVLFDRMQAEQLVGHLTRERVRTREYVFSTAGTNRLARSLYTHLRDRALRLPDDPELISELSSTRLVETGPGTVKLQNPPGTHDDLAVVVGMATSLVDRPSATGASPSGYDRCRPGRACGCETSA